MDYVDLYLCHWPWKKRFEYWKDMEKMYAEGKCKAIGVSNFYIPHLEEFLKKTNIVPVMN